MTLDRTPRNKFRARTYKGQRVQTPYLVETSAIPLLIVVAVAAVVNGLYPIMVKIAPANVIPTCPRASSKWESIVANFNRIARPATDDFLRRKINTDSRFMIIQLL